MTTKRPREKDSSSLLAAEIRMANKDSAYEIEKRTKYIKYVRYIWYTVNDLILVTVCNYHIIIQAL